MKKRNTVVKSLFTMSVLALTGFVANGQLLETRDGFGIWQTDSFEVKAVSDAEFLMMEVPMEF